MSKLPKNLPAGLDPEGESILYEGANMSQLAQILGRDHRTLKEKLHNVPPYGHRRGVPVWRIRDIVHLFWKPSVEDVNAAMSRMHHNDLPPILRKEYWNGLLAKQKFEREEGDLWPTVLVIEKMGEVFKLFKMSVLLQKDEIARNTELTDAQREALTQLNDNLLRNTAKLIQKEFTRPVQRVRVEAKPTEVEDDDAPL